jgi:dipeptidyl aminopeptidase/acylaminoacyl peptidase
MKLINRQYGLWDSPISPASLARGTGFSDIRWDPSGALLWRESRSDRGVVVVRPPDGQAPRDLNSDFSVRARVGYGGGDFSASQGYAYFVDAESGRIFRQALSAGTPEAVTPAFGQASSPAISPDGRWMAFVHTYEGRDSIGIIPSSGEVWPTRLVSGEDFYMQPCWHPHGDRLAWVSWDFPNMPWDGTWLRLGSLRLEPDGLPVMGEVTTLTGGEDISVFQPCFSPDGRYLAYAADPTGWWQLYVYDFLTGEHRQLTFVEAEHGLPAWTQGMRVYDFSPDGTRLYFIRNQDGFNSLWQVELASGIEMRLPLDERYTSLGQIAVSPDGEQIALIASGGEIPTRLILFHLSGGVTVVGRTSAENLAVETYAKPEPLSWAGMDGEQVHGLFYPPRNPRFKSAGLPPLIVNIHGGPTSQRTAGFNLNAQYFTSRGYAYLEVNYRGSTGYGRQYRDKLRGSWGIYDVEDAVSGAQFLAEQERCDSKRMVIAGGSAGGFTVLKGLEDYPGFFKAGICLYGVSNQFTLAAETHKFEARYSDILLGPLPEAAELYRERSPIFFVNKIKDPIAIFQGENDVVVPRAQSDEVVASLRRRGVPHEYHLYPGEGHGFRKTETIEQFYKAVDKFLRQYVIFA